MDFLEVMYPVFLMCIPIILIMAIGIAFTALWLKLMDKNIRACPECGRKAAGTIIETEEEMLSNYVDHKRYNSVRVKKTKVTDHYKCDFCGYIWTRSFNRVEPISTKRLSRVKKDAE